MSGLEIKLENKKNELENKIRLVWIEIFLKFNNSIYFKINK